VTSGRDRYALLGLLVVAAGFALFGAMRRPAADTSAKAVPAATGAAVAAPPANAPAEAKTPAGQPAAAPSLADKPQDAPGGAPGEEAPEPPAPTNPVAFNGAGFRPPVTPDYLDTRAKPDSRDGTGVALDARARDPKSAEGKRAAADEALRKKLEARAAAMRDGPDSSE